MFSPERSTRLRSQTQLRLDEGFFGFDTRLNLRADQENLKLGAGALPGVPFLVAHSLTSGAENGDFKLGTAQSTKLIPGGRDPVLLVVKKRVSILKNLIKWVLSVRGENDDTVPGGRIIRGVPLLLIDDEADYASANTKEFRDEDGNIDEDADPTNTNKHIRQLLTSFEKSAYVGYTATPFANVFMHHEAWSKEYGEDLFPRSFIINIPAPEQLPRSREGVRAEATGCRRRRCRAPDHPAGDRRRGNLSAEAQEGSQGSKPSGQSS